MIVSQNWFIKFASLHFAKVLIARTARTFGKVYKSDYQSLLESVVYGRFASTRKGRSYNGQQTNTLVVTNYLNGSLLSKGSKVPAVFL